MTALLRRAGCTGTWPSSIMITLAYQLTHRLDLNVKVIVPGGWQCCSRATRSGTSRPRRCWTRCSRCRAAPTRSYSPPSCPRIPSPGLWRGRLSGPWPEWEHQHRSGNFMQCFDLVVDSLQPLSSSRGAPWQWRSGSLLMDLSAFSALSNEKKGTPTLLLACRDFITLDTRII